MAKIKPFCRPAGANHVVCRCFYCLDSKTRTHGHFYISIPPENSNDPSLFYCQKCHASGIVTSQKLLEWGIFESSIAINLTQRNAYVLSLPENRKYKDSDIYRISNTTISQDKLSEYKLNYINGRIGTNLSMQECIDNKIVINLNDLINENHLQYTRDQRIVNSLDSDFVGFLSYDNAFLNMRNLQIHDNLHPSINKRYINYHVFNKYDNTNRVYVIPNWLNLTDPNPIELHMAEGPFDILSIKYNLVKNPYNKIFAAILGSGYKGLVRFILTQLKTPNLVIHLYADADISRDTILDLAEFIEPFRIPIYLHRNIYEGEKDYGVPMNRIIDSVDQVN